MRTAIAIRHVGFEDVGTFAGPLTAAGYALAYRDAGVDPLDGAADADLMIVLGGPIGIAEQHAYPVLTDEIALVRARLAAGRPTLGICLGAQVMAAALGAEVRAMAAPEIGFAPLTIAAAGMAGPLRHLADVPVLHWHGDACALPAGTALLASTAACPVQAFGYGDAALALQCHPEVDPRGIERWLIGHAAELAAAGIDPAAIRRGAAAHGATLAAAGVAMMTAWLAAIAARDPSLKPGPH